VKPRRCSAPAVIVCIALALIAWAAVSRGGGTVQAASSIAFVQSTSIAQTGGRTASKAFPDNVTSGHLIIVGSFVGLGASVSVTDSLGNTFTQVAHQTVASDHDADVFVGTVASSGADTITVNAGSGENVYAFSMHEYSGVSATVDASATAQGNSTAAASGSLTTVTSNDLVFAWFTNGSNHKNENFSSLNSAYTMREMSGTGTLQCYAFANCVESGDLVAGATLTTNATATLNVSDIWSATVIAFKGAGPVLVSGLACNPTTLGPSAVSTCTVTLTQTAATVSSVTLASNNTSLTVPASVTVAAGATTATFSATTAATIASDQSATVAATLGSSSSTATINLVPAVVTPVLVSGVACIPASLGQGAVSICTVTLNQTALTGGSSVTLASNNASLTVPAAITIGAGATTATFSAIAAAIIASNQSATVTATLGSSSQSAAISLVASVTPTALVCTPTSLGPNASSTCTVTLNQSAPSSGTSVTLTSNDTLLTVPASVMVAAGATTATFSATASANIASNQSAMITATASGISRTATIDLVMTPGQAITFVQSTSTAQTGGRTASKAFPDGVTSDHLIIVGSFVDLGATVSVTDSLGNTFTQVAHQTVASDHDADVFVGTAGSSGADTITLNAGSGKNVYAFSIHEYSGVTTTVDASATAQGSSTAAASGSLTTITPNDLIFAWFTNGSNHKNENFSSLNSAYTKREMSGTGTTQCYAYANCVESGDLVAGATLTTNATATLDVADIWSATVVALKGAGSTLGDTTPPTVPTNLSASAVSQSQINLSWSPSTDNVGVAGYQVFRNGTMIGNSSGTSFSDTPLSASTTYTYTVTAFDAAGNVSAQSLPASATTLPPGIPPPSGVPSLVHSTASENSQGNTGTGGNTTVYSANIDPVIPGNCLGVAFGWSTYYSQPSGFAPTDDKGDKFYQVAENPDDTTNYYKMQVWMTPPITSGARYVSIPFGVQTTEVQAIVFEVANCGATSGAIVDGQSSNTGSGTAVTAGSLTPGTSGDLLLQFAVVDTASCSGSQCKRTIPAATGVSAFSQSNITWALRHAELLDGTLMQGGVYSSATAIDPEMTLASSGGWISIAIAIKGASGGGAPTGPNISSIQHVSMWSTAQSGPGYANPSVTQFPSACATDCTVVVAVNGGCDISSISYGGTPLSKRLTYIGPGASETEQFFDLVGYTPDNADKFSITPDLGCTSVNGYDWTWTLVFYDFADTYSFSFDKVTSPGASGYVTGSCSGATCDTVGASITPAVSSGILLTEASQWYNQVSGISTPWLLDVIYDSTLYQSPALDEQNGWAHYYNTSTSSETPTWNYISTAQVAGFWASASISYSAVVSP
jgi:hypothetical protein